MDRWLLLVHLLAAIVWVGGMFFAHFAMRPALRAVLEPPRALAVTTAALGRFFRFVTVAVVLLFASGGPLFHRGGAAAPLGWWLMLGLGIVMTGVFGVIAGALYPRLRKAVDAGALAEAGPLLARIRALVLFNLVLGTAAVAAVALSRG